MPTPENVKPFKTYDEQISLLKSRGLIISDDDKAREILKRMNYYRLSAYSLTLRKDDVFYPGVSIEDIVALYDFDAKLRSIIFEYSSKVETTLRAYIAYYHAQKYGPLGYLNNQNFDNELNHSKFLSELFNNIHRSSGKQRSNLSYLGCYRRNDLWCAFQNVQEYVGRGSKCDCKGILRLES